MIKKLILISLFATVFMTAVEVNAQTIGWNQQMDDVFKRMRAENHPDYAGMDPVWKYLSGDQYFAYAFGSPEVKYSDGSYCGRDKIKTTVDVATDIFTADQLKGWENISENATVKWLGAQLPTGLNETDVYYLVHVKTIDVNKKTFQISRESSGKVVDVSSVGEDFGFYASDEMVYRPTGCNSMWDNSDANAVREHFADLARRYGQLKSLLKPIHRWQFRSILDHFTDCVLYHKNSAFDPVRTGFNDSDQLIGSYFGLAIYAAVIASDGEKARAEEIMNHPRVGGWKATANNTTSNFRNSILHYFTDETDGVWLESSDYNLGTTRLFLQNVWELKNFLGVDHFPEITALNKRFAEALKYELWNNVGQKSWGAFSWGDVEHDPILPYYRQRITAIIASINENDPDLWYLYDMVNLCRALLLQSNVRSAYENPYRYCALRH